MMKRTIIASFVLMGFIAGLAAQGPIQSGSETVARPRKKVDPSNPEKPQPAENTIDQAELPKIPSKLTPKNKEEAGSDVSFKAETNIVNVDVSVLDNSGNPIPNIPKG